MTQNSPIPQKTKKARRSSKVSLTSDILVKDGQSSQSSGQPTGQPSQSTSQPSQPSQLSGQPSHRSSQSSQPSIQSKIQSSDIKNSSPLTVKTLEITDSSEILDATDLKSIPSGLVTAPLTPGSTPGTTPFTPGSALGTPLTPGSALGIPLIPGSALGTTPLNIKSTDIQNKEALLSPSSSSSSQGDLYGK
jgi:hypothetical protein